MDLHDPFRPRPSTVSLVFASKRGGHIQDLKRGIRRFLTRYYPAEVALRLAMAPTYNYLFSHDRRDKCIVLTADGGIFSEAVLIEIFARLSQQCCQLRTPLATYEATIEGVVDAHRLQAISAHYLWTSSFFERHIGRAGERHLMN
jgi:hypothetical protein